MYTNVTICYLTKIEVKRTDLLLPCVVDWMWRRSSCLHHRLGVRGFPDSQPVQGVPATTGTPYFKGVEKTPTA